VRRNQRLTSSRGTRTRVGRPCGHDAGWRAEFESLGDFLAEFGERTPEALKAATDRLSADMAHELREHGIASVSLYPGLVRTEAVMANAKFFDFSNSESPQFIGRVIAALAADPRVMEKSGKTLVAAALALDYGVTDVDGKQPRPLSIDEF